MGKGLLRGLILAHVVALAGTPAAHAGVVYVNKSARGAVHDGTSWKTAYTTVSDALADSTRLSTEVWVAQGIYYEDIQVPVNYELYGGFMGNESDRSQRNPAANQTVLRGSGTGDTVITCNVEGVVVDGFLIQAGTVGVNIDGQGAAATLEHNIINAQMWGVTVGSYVTATLIGNTITGSTSMGVNIASNSSATLTRNTISGSGYDGVNIDGTCTLTDNLILGNGNGVESTGTVILTGNTIAGNGSTGVLTEFGTTQMINNIVAFNRGGGVNKSATGNIPVPSHNNVFGNTPTDYDGTTPPADQGNIGADPLFVDLANGDVHLQAGSPCIDAGFDAAVLAGETDRDGNPRVAGAHVDIGCYEFIATIPAPYSIADVAKALGIAGGAINATSGDLARLTVEPGTVIDLHDTLRLARKLAGLEANP